MVHCVKEPTPEIAYKVNALILSPIEMLSICISSELVQLLYAQERVEGSHFSEQLLHCCHRTAAVL